MKTITAKDAKNRLGQVIDTALAEGAVMISKNGRESVVLVSVKKYREFLSGTKENISDSIRAAAVNNLKFGILPKNYREQKSEEQARYQAAARFDPSLIRRGQVFKDVCKDHVVKVVYDPYDVPENERYGY